MLLTVLAIDFSLFMFLIGVCIVLPLTLFSIPLLMVWTHHKRKMEEIRLHQQGNMTEQVRAEFQAVREEIRALRDTSMQYDLSLDDTLQQIERRMETIERQNRIQPQVQEASQQNVTLGGRA